MRSRRATAYPAPRRYHITRCDPYDSDTEAGEGVLFDFSPAGYRMRSDIALNAGTYLTLRIAVAQEPTPLAVEVSVVRWCKDGHFGVEFLRYSQGDRERVTNLDHATLTLTAVGP